MNHIGIYISNNVNRHLVIENILSNNLLQDYANISGMQGELYSTITINRIIDEELRHDWFPVTTTENSSLLSMSSGQQRKALLIYLIGKKPQYLVLDDIFSNVDAETQDFIRENLKLINSSTLFIQLFYRKQDVLDSVKTVLTVNDQLEITEKQTLEQFSNTHHASTQIHSITLPHLFTTPDPVINPLVQLNGVSAQYVDKPVLKDIHWTIQIGEFWQLRGPIGSGKSTLLSMIIGDNPRGYGQDMVLFGKKKGTGETIWDIRKRIGYFTASMTLQFSHEDSVENMLISGLVDSVGLYVKPTDLQRRIAHEWMQVLGDSFRNKTFNALSAGQQRIVLVARAMVKHPPLLILDEPTAGLDDENTERFISLIKAIASQQKVAIIYVSHRQEPGLKPEKIFTLVPTNEGSIGKIE